MSSARLDREYFESLVDRALQGRKAGEHLLFNYSAEESQFVRLNAARVRQLGTVEDAEFSVTLVIEGPGKELRTAGAATTLTGLSYTDHERIAELLARLRHEAPQLPVDPYAQLPKEHGSSREAREASLLPFESATDALLEPLAGVDIAGLYAAGTVVRAMANSAGLKHWFSSPSYCFDYSLYTAAQRALKGTFAGSRWDQAAYRSEIEASRERLKLLERPARRLERGTYRAYLEPAAYADLVHMLNWGGLSEASLRQGDSPLRLLRPDPAHEVRSLSPLFSLSEDFSGGKVPRFNDEGELAPMKLPLIERGKLAHTLVSSRTASEYGAPANGAEEHESMRAGVLAGGSFARSEALARLGTGVFLSNLHYLNWSDQPGGRITGMTRYACFWVDNGAIVAPIENMRFDDSIFSLFGTALEDLTREQVYLPEVQTYERRELGGIVCPGALLKGMEFTL
jgi:predicted Zn-dependent protease